MTIDDDDDDDDDDDCDQIIASAPTEDLPPPLNCPPNLRLGFYLRLR